MADTTQISVGLELEAVGTAQELAHIAENESYSFGLLQLLVPSVQHTYAERSATAFERSQLQIWSADYAGFVVGGISPWVELDSPDAHIRKAGEQLVKQQINWASHLGLPSVIFTLPDTASNLVNFARVVNHALNMVSYTQVLVRVTLDAQSPFDIWPSWNLVRTLCNHNPKLSVALQLHEELPQDPSLLRRWFAEPVRTIILPKRTFITNAKGFPVLPKRHQGLLIEFFEHNVQLAVSLPSINDVHPQGGIIAYQQYLRHLHRSRPQPDEAEQFASGYHDYLQSPLQPLMDNLESATYEVFEKDPIKYREYEKAAYQALCDRVPRNNEVPCVVMVVGAGRGPLVERVLRAAESAGRNVRVYAVEKNPNAVVTLRCRKEDEWGDRVEVVHSDMRVWDAPEKTDILVSELLGSFGDNELSPECLDGAQRFLKDDGISIPSSYTAYISPISSTKLYNECASYNDQAHMETPYVVKFKAIYELADPVPVWKFEHPNREGGAEEGMRLVAGQPGFNEHNVREGKGEFFMRQDGVLHGIAGYFESVLYKDVMISIHPETHSEGMFSWFPLFFPLKSPIYLPANSILDLHFWRLCDARKVWYEWCAVPKLMGEGGVVTPLVGGPSEVHNVGGRSSWIGL
ncbi:Protein arginine N-methyltransferase 5 [Rhizophlyctis rosea]|nr:Protein arginine N-methyltransferase 5 [Rhizophlyctis rosea]